MRVRLKTYFNHSAQGVYEKLLNPMHLQRVSYPLLVIGNLSEKGRWEQGKSYQLSLSVLNVFPVVIQEVRFNKIDTDEFVIETSESSSLIKEWKHRMQVVSLTKSECVLEEDIELRAGMMTWPLFCYAHLLYRYRHRKTKSILKQSRV